MRIALLVPHIFMWDKIKTIFAPAPLVIDLAKGLKKLGHKVTLFSPGSVNCGVKNINTDLKYFQKEVEKLTKKKIKNGAIGELIKTKPLTYLTLTRQLQTDLVAKCYKMANLGKFDIVHVYTNEEEIAMAFSEFVKIPVVFTHHEPFNFLARYRTSFPKYKKLNFISISREQRKAYSYLHFVSNIHHGIDTERFEFNDKPKDYFAFLGRIIKPKGTHVAIEACLSAKENLKIAGQHYSGHGGDKYWKEKIKPFINKKSIEYVGYLGNDKERSDFLKNAKALLMPIQWEEPFGMVMLEAMSCGTPVIAFNKGSIPEIVKNGISGFVVKNISQMENAMRKIDSIDRSKVREYIKENFSLEKMVSEHEKAYRKLLK